MTAEMRSTEPEQLRLLRGDLDWITMKALEKDRARRYGTPSELAADIGRYLRHEPVVARPRPRLPASEIRPPPSRRSRCGCRSGAPAVAFAVMQRSSYGAFRGNVTGPIASRIS